MYETRTLDVDGIETFLYQEGSGPPLVMLHGIAANSEIWFFTLDEFRSDYTCYAPDLPGHGRSGGRNKPYSINFYVRWFNKLLDELEITEPFVLLGSSMGSAIAAAFTERYPDRVKTLILSNGLGVTGDMPWDSVGTLLPRLPFGLGLIITQKVDPFLYRYLKGQVIVDPLGHARRVVDSMAEVSKKSGLWPYISGLRVLLVDFLSRRKRKKFAEKLRGIKIPMLITWGRHDGILRVTNARKAMETFPDAELTIFENSAHTPMVDQPEQFNKRVKSFLVDHNPNQESRASS